MSWAVEPPIRVGDSAFAAIVETKITLHGTSPAMVAGVCDKRPALLIEVCRSTICGVDLDGRRYDRPQIEIRFPGAIAQILALTGPASAGH